MGIRVGGLGGGGKSVEIHSRKLSHFLHACRSEAGSVPVDGSVCVCLCAIGKGKQFN